MLAQWGKQDTVFTCPTAIIYKFYLPGATGQAPMSSPEKPFFQKFICWGKYLHRCLFQALIDMGR